MKAVNKGIPINKFFGLKSKMYSMLSDGKESNTAKRVNIATEFNEFKDTLFNNKIMRHKMKRTQSKKHKLGTSEINKKSLSCFDDKRFVLNDGIHTIAYFHRELKKQILKDDINKKRFSQTKRILKDSHKRKRFSEMITNKNECVQINFP